MSDLLIKASGVRKFCKARGRRISAQFLDLLDSDIKRRLESACAVHNGGKKTLDSSVFSYTNKGA